MGYTKVDKEQDEEERHCVGEKHRTSETQLLRELLIEDYCPQHCLVVALIYLWIT